MLGRIGFGFVWVLAGLLPVSAADPEMLHIGILQSLTKGTSPRLRESFAPKFAELVKDFTGLKSVTLQGINPATAARQLERGKWHLGIFNGVEFAWVRSKHPDLKPLMIAVFGDPKMRAVLMVKKDADLRSFKDLKGHTVCILDIRLHCRLFADKGGGGRAQDYFKLTETDSGEDALDNILLGKADAAVVDTDILKLYKDVNPGRFNQLKIAAQSETFPAPAIVYRQGALSDALLKKLRTGMLKANQSDKGREAMATFQISSFQPVPADYEKTLAAILKSYPPPE
jgi:ABC-type phosphate/phosphonate transport system substrate-binding protein